MAMTSQKTLDLPLIPCGWSLFLMEQLTKQDLQLTFLKVNVKAYFGTYELFIICFCARKKNDRIWKFFNLFLLKIVLYYLQHTFYLGIWFCQTMLVKAFQSPCKRSPKNEGPYSVQLPALFRLKKSDWFWSTFETYIVL